MYTSYLPTWQKSRVPDLCPPYIRNGKRLLLGGDDDCLRKPHHFYLVFLQAALSGTTNKRLAFGIN